jgi:hypothetical protein
LPLYLEELLRDTTNASSDHASVPAGLLLSLAARLDELGPVRELAQTAAVIGGDVPISLLAQISQRSESRTLDEAAEIVAAGIGGWTHEGEAPALRFSHALMADAAYDSLPKGRRRDLHADVAAHLTALGGEEQHPERVARHHELAENYPDAMNHWRSAARRAIESYALDEARAHLESAASCLEKIRQGADPNDEMKLRLTQIDYLNMRHGYTGEEQREAFDRITQLVEHDGLDVMSEFMALLKLTTQAAAVSRMDESNRWADRSLAFAERGGNPLLTGFVGAPVGTARLLNGRYIESSEILTKSIDALGVESPEALQPPIGEAWAMTLCILAHANAALGYTGEARRLLDASIAGTRCLEPADPHSICQALYFRGMLLLMEGEIDTLQRDAQEMIELGDKHGFAEHAAAGRMYAACREMIEGDAELGVAEFLTQKAAVPHYEPFAYLSQALHEGVARTGRVDEALEGAMALHEELVGRGEHFCSEELRAVIGAFMFERDHDLTAARATCQRGLDEAAERGAHGLRLRIALRYASLLEAADLTAESATVLEEAIAQHPDPDDCRRYEQAVAQLTRFQHANRDSTSIG